MQNAQIEAVRVTGEWSGYSLSPEIQESDPVIGKLRKIARGQIDVEEGKKIIRDLKNNRVLIKDVVKGNLVPTVGRAVLAGLLAGDNSYSGEINYIALGTGTTAFTNASVQLNTEVFRKLVSDAAFDDNIAYIDVFVASGDVADGTYTEAAAFIDGAVGTNTGQALSLVIQDFVKSGSMYLSLKVTIT